MITDRCMASKRNFKSTYIYRQGYFWLSQPCRREDSVAVFHSDRKFRADHQHPEWQSGHMAHPIVKMKPIQPLLFQNRDISCWTLHWITPMSESERAQRVWMGVCVLTCSQTPVSCSWWMQRIDTCTAIWLTDMLGWWWGGLGCQGNYFVLWGCITLKANSLDLNVGQYTYSYTHMYAQMSERGSFQMQGGGS